MQDTLIFLDIEGDPVEEFAAIEVNRQTREIIDVFHGYAITNTKDDFSRRHIHGLNPTCVKAQVPFPSEATLIAVFNIWIARKPCVEFYANDSLRESLVLKLDIKDFRLKPWAERKDRQSHIIARKCKERATPVLGRSCPPEVHSSFTNAPHSRNSATFEAKAEHGYHCALYDVLELYYEWLMS